MKDRLSARIILPTADGFVFTEDSSGRLNIPGQDFETGQDPYSVLEEKMREDFGLDLAKLAIERIDKVMQVAKKETHQTRRALWLLYGAKTPSIPIGALKLASHVEGVHVINRSLVLGNHAISVASKRALLKAFTQGY